MPSPRVAAALLAGAVFLSAPAAAHSWYSQACCHDRDCAPLPYQQAPHWTSSGWRLHDGSVVPFSKIEKSQDGGFHLCQSETGVIYCLYVPDTGA